MLEIHTKMFFYVVVIKYGIFQRLLKTKLLKIELFGNFAPLESKIHLLLPFEPHPIIRNYNFWNS